MSELNSKIIKLTASNVKRLHAVEITPDGNLITIGGRNGAGKSSVLDAIWWGITGGRAIAEVPVRKGEERAVIDIDLGDLKIHRTISPNGDSMLTLKGADGVKIPSPQAILDGLLGKIGFDPLAFSRQDSPKQYDTLRTIAGLDFTAIDKKRQDTYDLRTILGREVKTLEGQLAGLREYPDVPESEKSTDEIMQRWREASAVNEKNQKARNELVALNHGLESIKRDADGHRRIIKDFEARIEELKVALGIAQNTLSAYVGEESNAKFNVEAKEKEIAAMVDSDIGPFQAEIKQTEETNRIVRQNQQRKKVAADLALKRKDHSACDSKIENCDIEKRRMIAQAKFPIEGLGFEAGRILFNGIPFDQISSAEQLKVSVAVGIALNPKLKVLLIRDGSLLDDGNLKVLAAMAQEAGAQIWLEKVGTDGDVSVIIEDGRVKGAPIEEPEIAANAQRDLDDGAPELPIGLPTEEQIEMAISGKKRTELKQRVLRRQLSDPEDIIP
jgi:hypothetical protein